MSTWPKSALMLKAVSVTWRVSAKLSSNLSAMVMNSVQLKARQLLILFEELQVAHIEHFERLQRQLADG